MKILIVSPFFNPETKKVTSGVDFHRLIAPHYLLNDTYEDISIGITTSVLDDDALKVLGQYDFVVFNRSMQCRKNGRVISTKEAIRLCKSRGCNVIMDIDDYWSVDKGHPASDFYLKKVNGFRATRDEILDGILEADIITVTNELLKEKVLKVYSKADVEVIPNGINSKDPQFSKHKSESDKIRFGFAKTISHKDDLVLLNKYVKEMYQDDRFVMISMNYSESSKPSHITLSDYENASREQYKLLPRVNANEYGYLYQNIDVMFTPLGNNAFNAHKSHLKMIECGFTNTIFLGSNVAPYSSYLNDDVNGYGFTNLTQLIDSTKFILNNFKEAKETASNLANDMKDFELSKVNLLRKSMYDSFS